MLSPSARGSGKLATRSLGSSSQLPARKNVATAAFSPSIQQSMSLGAGSHRRATHPGEFVVDNFGYDGNGNKTESNQVYEESAAAAAVTGQQMKNPAIITSLSSSQLPVGKSVAAGAFLPSSQQRTSLGAESLRHAMHPGEFAFDNSGCDGNGNKAESTQDSAESAPAAGAVMAQQMENPAIITSLSDKDIVVGLKGGNPSPKSYQDIIHQHLQEYQVSENKNDRTSLPVQSVLQHLLKTGHRFVFRNEEMKKTHDGAGYYEFQILDIDDSVNRAAIEKRILRSLKYVRQKRKSITSEEKNDNSEDSFMITPQRISKVARREGTDPKSDTMNRLTRKAARRSSELVYKSLVREDSGDAMEKMQDLDVGSRIAVYWSGSHCYYSGEITRCDKDKRGRKIKFNVKYDDGEEKPVNLFEREWYLESHAANRPAGNTDCTVLANAKSDAAMEQWHDFDVGSRVAIWWDGDHCYYPATIMNYVYELINNETRKTGKFYMKYDADGERHWEDLSKCRWILISDLDEEKLLEDDSSSARATSLANTLPSGRARLQQTSTSTSSSTGQAALSNATITSSGSNKVIETDVGLASRNNHERAAAETGFHIKLAEHTSTGGMGEPKDRNCFVQLQNDSTFAKAREEIMSQLAGLEDDLLRAKWCFYHPTMKRRMSGPQEATNQIDIEQFKDQQTKMPSLVLGLLAPLPAST